MRLKLQSTGREVRIKARRGVGGKARGLLWQGQTEGGVPVMAITVLVSPLIPADDPRQDDFEADYDWVLDPELLAPEIEMFPTEVVL